MRSTRITCTALLFEMCCYCVVFSIKYLPPLLQTLTFFSVALYPLSSLLSIGIGKHGRTNRLFGKGCILQCARNLHTAVCHTGEIREYHMRDTSIGSEVQYRWRERQRMLVEDDLQLNPKKQYRYNLNLHTAKVIELIF